jgi:limonene 1,2-monooxygenase
MILLDHLTRGRVMLGVGPGALLTDALMIGLNPDRQRPMMGESLDIILRLLTEKEPITYKSDWFELHEATTHLSSYTQPHLPVLVAAAQSPAGMMMAGRHGLGVLSFSTYAGVRGAVDLKQHWQVCEETAEQHGKRVSREEWRLVVPVHLAESRKEAMKDAAEGGYRHVVDYVEGVLGRPRPVDGPPEVLVQKLVDSGSWIVGTPDDAIAAIKAFDERSGGFGGLMVLAHDFASREKTLKSYELLARYVAPHFQGSLDNLRVSYEQGKAHSQQLREAGNRAIELAHQAYEKSRQVPSG